MATVRKVKIFENADAKIYKDAKDKNVAANMIYFNATNASTPIAFRDHECVVGYDADGLLEAFIKGALVCVIDVNGGETLYTPCDAYKDADGVVGVSYNDNGLSRLLQSIEGD